MYFDEFNELEREFNRKECSKEIKEKKILRCKNMSVNLDNEKNVKYNVLKRLKGLYPFNLLHFRREK
jgi:hypothetical protein